jgi:hypothetical protein
MFTNATWRFTSPQPDFTSSIAGAVAMNHTFAPTKLIKMKKLYTALVALGLALGANAQTWVLTNTGATQHLYTCAASAKSATDFYVWTAGEGHTNNSRKFANGTWSQWNDVSIGSPVINEISIIGFSQTFDPYIAYAFDAQAYLYADGLYTNATPQSVGERILSYSLYTAGGGYAASSTGKVYYPFSSTGNSNSNIGQLSLGNSPIVSVKVSDQLSRGVAISAAGDIYILTGGNPIVSSAPTTYTKTKGLRSLATNGGWHLCGGGRHRHYSQISGWW